MLDKSLLWYILETDGRSRQIVNGVVTSKSKKTPLPDEPIGGDDILIKWQRNENRHSVDRSFSLPIEFPKRSATILRDALYRNNIDRRLELLIQQFRSTIIDDNEFKDRYEYLYKGDIDFSTSEDFPEERKFKVNLLEYGLSQLVKAAANTEYFIPFDDDAKLIKMDGVQIDNKAAYSFIDIEDRSGLATGYEDLATIPFVLINKEGASSVAVFSQDADQIKIDQEDYMNTSANYFLINQGKSPVTFRVKGKFEIEVILSLGSNKLYVDFKKPDGTKYIIFDALDLSSNTAYSYDFDFSITLNPGEKLFLFRYFTGGGLVIMKYAENPAEITFATSYETTYIKCFTASDLFKKLCNRMGIPINKIYTPLLDGCGIAFTSGDGIRGIEGAGIKTKYNDFEKFIINTLFGRVAIRDTISVEDRLAAYDITRGTTSLGNVSGIKITPASDKMYSSIKVGWKEQDIEDVNGKFDPNGVMIFSTPVKRGEGKELDLTCPYKAGPYEIEIKRINLDSKSSTDDNADNEVYAIAVAPATNQFTVTAGFYSSTSRVYYSVIDYEPQVGQRVRFSNTVSNNMDTAITGTGYEPLVGKYFTVSSALTDESALNAVMEFIGLEQYQLDRSIAVTSGVPSPATIFNIPLTPGRILQKHLRWIRSFLYNYEPESIIFESANRNSDLVAGGLTEKANIAIADMGERIFLPYYMEFTSKVRSDFGTIMDEEPDRGFDWDSNGDWKGFLQDGGLAANKKTPQIFKMLFAADNDITRLVI